VQAASCDICAVILSEGLFADVDCQAEILWAVNGSAQIVGVIAASDKRRGLIEAEIAAAPDGLKRILYQNEFVQLRGKDEEAALVASLRDLVEAAENEGPWDVLWSHAHSTGGAQTQLLVNKLTFERGLRCWLDMNMSKIDIVSMKAGISDSACFGLFLSAGCLSRPYCQLEIRYAMALQKPLLLVLDDAVEAAAEVAAAPPDIAEVVRLQLAGATSYRTKRHETSTMLDLIMKRLAAVADLTIGRTPSDHLSLILGWWLLAFGGLLLAIFYANLAFHATYRGLGFGCGGAGLALWLACYAVHARRVARRRKKYGRSVESTPFYSNLAGDSALGSKRTRLALASMWYAVPLALCAAEFAVLRSASRPYCVPAKAAAFCSKLNGMQANSNHASLSLHCAPEERCRVSGQQLYVGKGVNVSLQHVQLQNSNIGDSADAGDAKIGSLLSIDEAGTVLGRHLTFVNGQGGEGTNGGCVGVLGLLQCDNCTFVDCRTIGKKSDTYTGVGGGLFVVASKSGRLQGSNLTFVRDACSAWSPCGNGCYCDSGDADKCRGCTCKRDSSVADSPGWFCESASAEPN